MARKEKIESEEEFNNPFAQLQVDNLRLGDKTAPPASAPAPASGPTPIFAPPSGPPSHLRSMGRVVLRRETAHRGGKTVIVIHDFASFVSTRSIEELGRKLRQMCGCGGTTRERMIEIQGNHAAKIRRILEEEGFRVAGVK